MPFWLVLANLWKLAAMKPKSNDSSNAAPATGSGTSAGDPTVNINYEPTGLCWGSVEANEMLLLTNNKSLLKARINQLEAFGSTGGALGTAMAWFSILPNFGGIWPSSSTPKSYSLLSESGSTPKKLVAPAQSAWSDK